MNTYYKAQILKSTEEDNFNEGCLTGTSTFFGIITTLKNPDLKKLIVHCEEFCNGQAFIFDGENNRIEIQVLEDENSCKADECDIELWKEGKKKLYLSNYSCYITKVTEDNNIVNELESLNLETI